MSVTYISSVLRRLVEERANQRCEYCQLLAGVAVFSHEIDHVIAEKHGGARDGNNLAFTCWRCNRYKGSELGSFAPQTGTFSFLFSLRTQRWAKHFKFLGTSLIGLTPKGRTTIKLLQINSEDRRLGRQRLSDS